jgi:hypothetical protein
MSVQIIMDHTGDTRHEFNPSDDLAVAEAEKRFMELTGKGFIVAERTGTGTSNLVRSFNLNAEETVFIPHLMGG